jgi:hypothetical protein
MFCYKDMTFCTFYKDCTKRNECHRPLTPKVEAESLEFWKQAGLHGKPIYSQFMEKPQCHEGEFFHK